MCLYTEDEAATAAKVSRSTIRRMVKEGRIRWVNYGTGKVRSVVRIPCGALADVQAPEPEATPVPRRRRRRPTMADPIW